ncbi:helix-turn-helix domain-containing protein [Brasilonema sp. UFV-L1]|uniref:helix-turn-helix domain-containing protein n=1 Tax=Brasilonema sp. UFV-L1 TaxID=2234130 RepID=UPI00145F7A25
MNGLSEQERKRLEVVQQLLAAEDILSYRELQQKAAAKLGISARSLRRLMQRWRESGISAHIPHLELSHILRS